MSQTKYWVIDPRHATITLDADGREHQFTVSRDAVIATTVLDSNEIYEPEPAIRHGVENLGWRIIQKELPPSGLNDLGHVDWKVVADNLAAALDLVLSYDDDEQYEEHPTETASRAMDDFRIAQTEAALANGPDVIVEDPND